MFFPPFEIVRCSWPRPIVEIDGRWASEPEWDAPALPAPPQPRLAVIHGVECWTLDWCKLFDGGLRRWDGHVPGEMRGFHVVFQLRIMHNGTLEFWDDDGSIIRRDGVILHCDQTIHELTRSTIVVRAGDLLEVAQWQAYGGWQWGARLQSDDDPTALAVAVLKPYLNRVCQRLHAPDGPPLKLFTHGGNPARVVTAVYSLVLNGYCPAEVLLFGEHQWSAATRALVAELLPFARIVPTADVLDHIGSLGQPTLANLAYQHWFVFKSCVGLLAPPTEHCMIDDDLIILDTLRDALEAFQHADLVFAPDDDYSARYLSAWGGRAPLRTGRFNAGLYWLRGIRDPRQLATDMLRRAPGRANPMDWEQGVIATTYAQAQVVQLPTQRYFYPCFDGLPGGPLGYDYRRNPCGFASIHFGGLAQKPDDSAILSIAPGVLDRTAAS